MQRREFLTVMFSAIAAGVVVPGLPTERCYDQSDVVFIGPGPGNHYPNIDAWVSDIADSCTESRAVVVHGYDTPRLVVRQAS